MKYNVICCLFFQGDAENIELDTFITSYISELKHTLKLVPKEHIVNKRSDAKVNLFKLKGLNVFWFFKFVAVNFWSTNSSFRILLSVINTKKLFILKCVQWKLPQLLLREERFFHIMKFWITNQCDS